MELVKKIRERTGAGMVAIKKAIDEAGGNEEKAIEILRKQGESKAAKKADRVTKEGVVVSYVHSNKVAAVVKLLCETDFVARNEEFVALAKDIAMHVAAMSPKFIKPEEMSNEVVEKEKEIWIALLAQEGKTPEMMEKIMIGKEKKFREESALLTQSFVKNPEITINELIVAAIGKMGEKIEIAEISRIEL
jgi:elongation factor Ts